jgi:hypothetical protein
MCYHPSDFNIIWIMILRENSMIFLASPVQKLCPTKLLPEAELSHQKKPGECPDAKEE